MKNNKPIITTLLMSMVMASAMAQQASQVPKLVVNITIDQLRTEYLKAFSAMYSEGGFKRLLNEGEVYTNVQFPFNHIDRANAIASIATGTEPYNHGIVAETWMDRATLQPKFCVQDRDYKGINTSDQVSPKNLLVSTIGDELKLATTGKGLVFSVAPTMESAVLAAGHSADWAMWIDDETGNWAGSDYYGKEPSWIKSLNRAANIGEKVKDLEWEPSDPYTGHYNYYLSTSQKAFKHKFTEENGIRHFKQSALVNDEVTRAACYCLSSGNAGLDHTTDYLSVCYYAGNYCSKSMSETTTELQDTYRRLDREIAKLLKTIDELVGLNETLIVVTSTGHETSTTNDELAKYKIPTGRFNINRCAALLNMYLVAMYGNGQYVEAYYGSQIYLNHKFLEQKQLQLAEVLKHAEDFLYQFSGVRDVFTSQRIQQGAWTPGISSIRNGYNPICSGDIEIKVAPGWNLANEDRPECTKMQRDSFFEFPLIFFGFDIKAEKSKLPVTTNCIAPTIAHHIRIRAPNACSTAPLF